MPYDDVSGLPASVRNNLPRHAQEIYMAAYNNAWEGYKSAQDRKGGASREEVSHKVAWNAVKKKYEKKAGKWRRKKNDIKRKKEK